MDLADGTFQVEHTDLSLGQAEPRGITLSRYYNGTRRFSNPAGMAGGWIHNYCVTANNVAAPQACLGGTTPAQAAAMLTATAAAIALYNGAHPDPKNWLTTALIAKWGVDQLTKSGVSVNLGKDTLAICPAAQRRFHSARQLHRDAHAKRFGLQRCNMRHGNTFNFNAAGWLTNIVDQYSQLIDPDLQCQQLGQHGQGLEEPDISPSITPARRTRLTSVSDGTRTVSYGYSTTYNPQGDLTSFTDPEGKTSTIRYDTNHQITATLDALKPVGGQQSL